MKKSEESKKIDNEQPITYCGEKIIEYSPDHISCYSNSSGTVSYDSILSLRREDLRFMKTANMCEINNTEKQYLHEENLLSAPIAIETLDWEMVKQLNGILQTKRRASKTTVVDSDKTIDMDQLKKVVDDALKRFLAKPSGMAMQLSTTFSHAKPASLTIQMCSTALARGKCHLLSRNCLEEIFQTHPDYIHEKDFASLKRKRLKILTEGTKKMMQAQHLKRVYFPNYPPIIESRSYTTSPMFMTTCPTVS